MGKSDRGSIEVSSIGVKRLPDDDPEAPLHKRFLSALGRAWRRSKRDRLSPDQIRGLWTFLAYICHPTRAIPFGMFLLVLYLARDYIGLPRKVIDKAVDAVQPEPREDASASVRVGASAHIVVLSAVGAVPIDTVRLQGPPVPMLEPDVAVRLINEEPTVQVVDSIDHAE